MKTKFRVVNADISTDTRLPIAADALSVQEPAFMLLLAWVSDQHQLHTSKVAASLLAVMQRRTIEASCPLRMLPLLQTQVVMVTNPFDVLPPLTQPE